MEAPLVLPLHLLPGDPTAPGTTRRQRGGGPGDAVKGQETQGSRDRCRGAVHRVESFSLDTLPGEWNYVAQPGINANSVERWEGAAPLARRLPGGQPEARSSGRTDHG